MGHATSPTDHWDGVPLVGSSLRLELSCLLRPQLVFAKALTVYLHVDQQLHAAHHH